MIQLEKQFEGTGAMKGISFKQIEKSERGFIYQLTDNETGNNWFEVFEKKVQKSHSNILGGVEVKFPEKELYAHANSFGISAWCIREKPRAYQKWKELNNETS